MSKGRAEVRFAQHRVAFVPTRDSDKAKAFYEGVLGLRFVKDDGFALVLDANGIMVRVAKVPPGFTPAQFTILGWQVTDIENVVEALQGERRPLREIRFSRGCARNSTAPTGERRRRGSRIPTATSCRCHNITDRPTVERSSR